ncbi:hypothetical protein DFH06DRAFT_725204 [Mycena polygramma]|nr:hypothetical protein DFH06DRAFT_725204 [Mycena polygramma]
MSDKSNTQHLVLAPVPAYGHTRPLCALAGRLTAHSNVVITMLMAPNYLKEAQGDIAAQFAAGHEALSRIRIVSLLDSSETQPFVLMPLVAGLYPAAYETLWRGDAIACASTGTTFAAVPPPVAVVLDVFAIQQFYATRAISGTTIPILIFVTANAGALVRMFCPESMGGQGELFKKIDAEALRLGKSTDEVGDKMFHHTDGTVIRIPGVPPMYDYEFFPQIALEAPVATMHKTAHDMVLMGDGLFVGICRAYDGETFDAFENYVRQLRKPIYPVGPLLPPGYGAEQKTLTSTSLGDMEAQSFLDSMGSKYGKNSVLYISFGSVFWPKLDEQLEDLIDALVEKQFPFILCHPSPLATVSDAVLEKISTSGIGLATKWAPQQFILTHPATGWFLTHCGHGGVTESLASGVPMICWPFQADQPIAAMHLSQTLNVAFHLIEVRTAKGLQPLYNGQVPSGTPEARRAEFRAVIEDCHGAVGAEKRRNVRRVQGELAATWAADGASTLSIGKFFAERLTAA